MKTARFILKIVATVMTLAAVVCAIVAFWDQIMDLFDTIIDKVEEKRADHCFEPEEFDDYDDSIL
ncbi:MAG: hypothetical protein K2M15_06520 [Oscillospiraceae bacterium]|nr:hypothetical protein [Oscillospiraceae bacterium]MDE7171710.1 hypothetical protein [Oscillospiraceae bacterium]